MLAVAVDIRPIRWGRRRRQAGDRGKALAGKCTLNRLELTEAEVDEQERYKKIAMDPDRIDGWMVDAFVQAHDSAPEEMVAGPGCDRRPDSWPAGRPLLSRLLRPLLLSPALHLLGQASVMRPVAAFQYRWGGGIGAGTGTDRRPDSAELAGGVDHHPGRLGLLPGGTCCVGARTHQVDYVMVGLAKNDRLQSKDRCPSDESGRNRVQRHRDDRRGCLRISATGRATAGPRQRRVIGKAEFLHKGANPRFVVTSLSPERLGARALYEDFYCARGDMENRIKEQQLDLFADRTSAGNDARQSTPAVSVLRRLHAHARIASSRIEGDPLGAGSVSDDPLEAPEDRRPRSASRSATSGSPCRKPIPTARSSLPSFETSRPFLCAAEVCPDQTPPKTKSFHRSGRALPEYIPSRSSEPEKRSIHDHPHHRITRPGPDR